MAKQKKEFIKGTDGKYYKVDFDFDLIAEKKKINDKLIELDNWKPKAIDTINKQYDVQKSELLEKKQELDNLN